VRITRRTLLAGAAGAAGAALADASAIEPFRLRVTRHDVVVPGLPAALAGLRVAQVADVHLPGTPAVAEEAVRAIRREMPELVLLSGDIVEHASTLPALTAFAGAVRGRIATAAVLGNWEHKAGITPEIARAAYGRAGVRFLCNESATVRVGSAELRITGFDDPVVGRPDATLAGGPRRTDAVELWLIHAPAWIDTLPATVRRPAAILSGHTHGGQIRLPGVTLFTPPGSGRYVSGWYRDALAPLYVSRGIGTASVRMRFFCPPELPIFTLRRG
jgi:predicted MPP superfamily phosphohydrolase